MSSNLTWRFNEGTIVPAGATIGGTIEYDGASYYVTQNNWYCYTTSSSDGVEGRAYWWFDTSVVPDSAIITSVQFRCRYGSPYFDTYFAGVYYFMQSNLLGATLNDTDFNTNNYYTGLGGGVQLGVDFAPSVGGFYDTGELSGSPYVDHVSKTGYTNVIAKMYAGDVTSSFCDYSGPSGWRAVTDVVPRLIVKFTANDTFYSVGTPAVVGAPIKVGTPTKVGSPTWRYQT